MDNHHELYKVNCEFICHLQHMSELAFGRGDHFRLGPTYSDQLLLLIVFSTMGINHHWVE